MFNIKSLYILNYSNKKEDSFFASKSTDNNIQNIKITESKLLPTSPEIIKNKCHECNKKLNITNEYMCKCNNIFCSKHRFADTHKCNFDHKANWKKIIEKNNPSLSQKKIDKI